MKYRTLYTLSTIVFRIWHPVFRVSGRENIPQEGNYLICPNHCGLADPFWVIMAIHPPAMPRIMAKDSVMKKPLLGRFLKSIGVIGVRRGENDIAAIKASLTALRSGQSLLIFPEGTRNKPGKVVVPKSGALLLSLRTGTPILPVYIETKRFPFSPMRCVIGAPLIPEPGNEHPTPDRLHSGTAALMQTIYALGEPT